MTINVLEEYIKITRNEINDYMKLIFERKFLKRISDQYIDAYINVRFYNFYNKDEELSFRKNYLNVIKETEKNIIEDYPEDQKLIEDMGLFYYYILYFDRISYRKNSKETVEKLYKMRKRILQKDNENFKEEFYKTYRSYLSKKIKFIKQFEDDEFFLKIIPYKEVENTNKVILQNNIKLPKVYSNWAIDKAFNTGIISEDKLLVEYNLVSGVVIRDLARGNFKKQYILQFETTLLKKTKKIKRLLNIIDNPAIQDKVNLEIKYFDFEKNKEAVYELMKLGFKFAVVIDNTMDVSFSTLKKLNVFNYCIVNKNLHHYEDIIKSKAILNNVIEI